MQQHFYAFRNSFAAMFVLLFVFTASILRGQTLYIGADNGDWLTASNWNNGVPASGNNATIPGGKIVVFNGSVTVDYNVDNFGTLINAGTTTVSGAISSGGAFTNNAAATLTVNTGGSVLFAGGFANAGTVTNRGTTTVNTAPLSNAATGIINNEATWNQFIGVTNDGIFSNKAGTFSCPQAFANNKTVENLVGATWVIDFGGTFTNATGSTLNNAGTFRNLSTFTNNTTVTNTGVFQNNGAHNCNGTFNNNGSGRLESTSTVNVAGRINNAATATIESGFRFNILANGYTSNAGTFINRDQIDIKTNGAFINETGASLTGQFGSSILNAGYFKVSANATVTKNGGLTNSNLVEIFGTYDAQAGSQINNSDSLCVAVGGLLKSVNLINNSGVWISKGTTENNSGSIWTNTGKIMVEIGGRINNNFDLINRPTGTIVNNGTLFNGVRLTNEGGITNNAYFVTIAEVLNKTGATLTNTEVLFLSEGSLTNQGTFTNQKTTIISSCAVLSNKVGATIGNTGRIESQGITLQRGTLTGNAVVQQGGFVQTSASSNAPSVCKPLVRAGTDITGAAKVDAAAVVATGSGLDSCLNIGYFVDGLARRTYGCADVGRTITNIPVKLVLRTGDSLTCVTSVTVFDGVGPIFNNCPKDATVFSVQDSAAYTWPTITATDNCSANVSMTSSKAAGSNFPIGTSSVTVSARDTFNNINDCMFRVSVMRVFTNPTCPATDNIAPVFTNCPANQTLSTQNGSVAATWTTPSVSDDCYPIVVQQNFNSGQLFQVGTTTVVYTARDAKNNTSTCTFTITVNGPADICAAGTDNIKPVIRNCPANFFGVVNNAINGAVGVWRAPSANDNCGFVNLTTTATSGQIFPVGTSPVTYTATDARGNTSTCQFNVLIAAASPCAGDVTPPSLTCPANVTVNTTNGSAVANWTAPAPTDACGVVTLNSTHTSGQIFTLGATVVNYYASDRVGNQSACGFIVNVVNACLSDTTRPTITNCPANITVVATNGTSATATWTAPSVADNCSGATLTSNFASGATFGVGTTTVMYTATDARGNQNTCTFTVTVNKSAVATCAGNIVLNPSFETNFNDWFTTDVTTVSIVNDVNSGAKAARLCGDNKPILSKLTALLGGTYTATAFAKITGAPTTAVVGIEFYDAAGVVLPTLRLTRAVTTTTYGAINFTFTKPTTASNFAFIVNKTGATGCLFVDDVCVTNPCTNDVTPPSFTGCPTNITINGTGTATTGIATWTAPVATDNCSTPAVVSNFTSGQSFPIGATTVTYTATDSKGLTGTCSFTVTYVNACANDVTPPSFGTTCPTNRTGVSTNGLCVAVNFTAPTATDNCGTPSVSGTHAANFCFPIGTTAVTYTAVDTKNNRTTCSFTVTITNGSTGGGGDCAATSATGGITREFFQLTSSSSPSPVIVPTTAPTTTTTLTSFVSPQNIADNYIQRVRGFLRPTVSGNYTFYITGNDNSDLYISTSTNPAAKTRIAFINGFTSNTELTKYPSQKSASVALVAGQNYYIEAVQQEGLNSDNLAVYWQVPTAPTAAPVIIPGANLVPFCTVDPCIAAPSVGGTVSPASQTIALSAAGVAPTRNTLSGYVGTIVRWEWQAPNSTVWNNWGGGGSASAPNNCCFNTVGTWKVRAFTKNGLCAEKVSSEGLIVVTATQTPVSCSGNLINNFSFESDLTGFNNWGSTTITTTNARSGAKAAQIGLPSGGFGYNFHVTQGTAVSFTSWNKTSGTVTWAGLGITFYDAAWVKIPTVEVTGAIAATNFSQVSLSAIAPVGAVNATVWAWKEGATGYMITDDWCLTTTPPAGFVPDPNKCYKIVNKVSGKVIDISGASTLNGAVVHQWDYVGGQNQKFKFVNAGNGFYSIRAVHSNLPLDIQTGSTTEGAYCVQRTLDGTGSQLFALPNVGGGFINLVNRTSGKALKIETTPGVNGTRLIPKTINATYEHQKWQIIEVSCTAEPCTVAGSVQFERWNNYINTTWTLPVLIPAGNPTISQTQGNTQGSWNAADNYMTRVRGYIKPQTTGVYCFNVTGDDNTELYLSPNSSAASMTRIASINGWTLEYENGKFTSQTSANITLTAGQLYYFEMRQVEGGGGDGWNIFWKTPTNATWQIINSQFLARPCTNGVYAATTNNVFTFMAKADVNQAQLQWVSNGGLRNDYYEVERVNELGDFEKIGTVNAATGKSEATAFTFTDANPLEGDNHYRIKTVENTGTIQFSGIETVSFAKNTEGVRLFPNPANDYVDIDLKKYNGIQVTISVYNQFGKLLQTAQIEKASNAPFHLELGDVATGSYLIRVQPQGKREVTKKLQIAK